MGLGEAVGLEDGAFVEGRMVALLRALGADYVLDTNFAADLTIKALEKSGLTAVYEPDGQFGFSLSTITSPFDGRTLGWDDATGCYWQLFVNGEVSEHGASSEVLSEVRKDRAFYENSGGGMTLSGGEPMAQFPFVRALCEAAKSAPGIPHIALETCGFAPEAQFRELLPWVDLFLFDIKTLVPEKHLRCTGVPLAPILDTLRFLDQAGATLALRCPLIPGLNDTEEELQRIAGLADGLSHAQSVDLEPYHPLGEAKSVRLGRTPAYTAPFPPRDYAQRIRAWLQPRTRLPVRLA